MILDEPSFKKMKNKVTVQIVEYKTKDSFRARSGFVEYLLVCDDNDSIGRIVTTNDIHQSRQKVEYNSCEFKNFAEFKDFWSRLKRERQASK